MDVGTDGVFAKYLEPDALKYLAGLKIKPDTRLLDVACGAGQIAIPAAKAGVKVTGVDLAARSDRAGTGACHRRRREGPF